MPLYLWHQRSALRCHLGGFFLWGVWSVFLHLLRLPLVQSLFYYILEWLFLHASRVSSLLKSFSIPLFWDNVYFSLRYYSFSFFYWIYSLFTFQFPFSGFPFPKSPIWYFSCMQQNSWFCLFYFISFYFY